MALAGGQSLMPMMNFRVARPGLLVDLNRLPGMAGIEASGDRVRIGAMTRYRELETSDLVKTTLPLLAAALEHVAHPAIRNRGTIGGSLALADPAAELPALALALGATLHLVSAEGRRDVGADDFFLGPYDTALEPGELIEAATASAFTKSPAGTATTRWRGPSSRPPGSASGSRSWRRRRARCAIPPPKPRSDRTCPGLRPPSPRLATSTSRRT